ncbi:hypothetical protein ACOJUR_04885 [Alicyclobacillus tolerans]|uniref:Uncharacterized protein n=2 Tax=Alicyclobacillus tolerans TaxID=90970 RepID=A0A1M6UVQ0_9BACL|nr:MULTISPECIES: hypothetical protein [Alicyclobacillus]MDP9729732.1 hypothetical protein [Alicyclobacillus tengchongensis]SHK73284.1 hypothetical protein SAMN05443507_12118 [Alicyclobacillus montanus]
MTQEHGKPAHNDANKTLPREEHEEKIVGEKRRSGKQMPKK